MESKGTAAELGGTAVAPPLPAPDRTAEFSGWDLRSIDDKGRVVLPPGYRPAFVNGGFLRKWPGPCIALWTPEGFREIDATLRQRRREKLGNPNARLSLYAGAPRVRPDSQGRLFLPEPLRGEVGIGGDVVVNGAGEFVQFWPSGRFHDLYEDGETALFDEIQTELGY